MSEKKNQYALKYKPQYADELFEHMSKGFGISCFNVEPQVRKSTIFQWLHDHEDFALARDLGSQKYLKKLELCLIIKAFGLTEEIQKNHVAELQEIDPLNIDCKMICFLLTKKFPKEYA